MCDRPKSLKRAVLLEWFTIGWNLVEAGVAIGAGIIAGSVALIGFGLDSVIESVSGVALLWRLRVELVSMDRGERAERRALVIVGVSFFLLAAYILYEAGEKLITGERPEASTVGLVLAAISLIVMPVLAYLKHRTGTALGSGALQADAMETAVCAWLSLALLLGLGLNALFGWWWADPIAALLMLPLLLREGWEAIEQSREGG